MQLVSTETIEEVELDHPLWKLYTPAEAKAHWDAHCKRYPPPTSGLKPEAHSEKSS